MKTALIFGSSGLIGNELLSIIIQNSNYNKIKLFVRSVPSSNDSKLEIIKTDFNNLEKLYINVILRHNNQKELCIYLLYTQYRN